MKKDKLQTKSNKDNLFNAIECDTTTDNLFEIGQDGPDLGDEELASAQINFIFSENDAVRMYQKGVTKFKLLSGQEEIELSRAIKSGDKDASKRLILSNLRLVVSIARRFRDRGLPLQDLIQEGMIGLIKAADKFNADRGCRFSTYASYWIRQTIWRALQDRSRAIRIPVHMQEKLMKIRRLIALSLKEQERLPSQEEILSFSYTDASLILAAFRADQSFVSLDMSLYSEDEVPLVELLEDSGSVQPDAEAEFGLLKQEINHALDSLNGQEQEVLQMRFGLRDGIVSTLDECAQKLMISKERVRQIEKKALKKLATKDYVLKLRDYLC